MQEIELKPCPFCGGEVQVYDDECGHYAIGCKFCCDVAPITTWEDTIEKAIAIWNTRNPKRESDMKEAFEKIKERLEEEVAYQSSKADKAGKTCAFEEITVVKAREKMAECYEHAIEIVNQVAEENKNKYVSIGAYKQVEWERDIAIEQLHELGYEFGQKIDKEYCEWIKYDYRTIAPKNHDVENIYWRIPEDMSRLRFCPYCGKEIKVVE